MLWFTWFLSNILTLFSLLVSLQSTLQCKLAKKKQILCIFPTCYLGIHTCKYWLICFFPRVVMYTFSPPRLTDLSQQLGVQLNSCTSFSQQASCAVVGLIVRSWVVPRIITLVFACIRAQTGIGRVFCL
jgi:hypothetical protein